MVKKISTKLHIMLILSICGIMVMLITIVYLVNTVSETVVVYDEITNLEIILLNMRRNKDNYLKKPNKRTVYKFKENKGKFEKQFTLISNSDLMNNIMKRSSQKSLSDQVKQYSILFYNYVDIREKIGTSENSGLMGKMRSIAHNIDKGITKNSSRDLKIDYLIVRQNEKDFLNRHSDIYLEYHRQSLSVLKKTCENDSTLTDLINRYSIYFHRISGLKKELGLSKDFGIWKEMRTCADNLEETISGYIEMIGQVVLIKLRVLRTVGVLVVLLVITAMLVTVFNSIRAIENSFSHFYDSFQRAKDSDLLIEQRELNFDEFNRLAYFANEMVAERKKLHKMQQDQNIDLEKKIGVAVEEIEKLDKEIIDTQREVIFTMGAIGESRSKETSNHVRRVAEYSELMAEKYGLTEKEVMLVKEASPMHDIGKVAISDAILKKPGKLTIDEFDEMKKHAELGYEMLKHSLRPLLKTAAIIAKEHHEKWNGTGYPEGKAGEEIHIYGRITALADVFDALGSDRIYKKAWPDDKIFQLINEERGKHFDPLLVDIFFDNLSEFLKIRDTLKDIISDDNYEVS